MRRFCPPHERWRGRLHQFPGESVNVSAHVQPGIHDIRGIILQCWDSDRRDVLCEPMRRVCGSHERRCWRLHWHPNKRVDMSANVRCWVYGIRDELVLFGIVDSCDVLSNNMWC